MPRGFLEESIGGPRRYDVAIPATLTSGCSELVIEIEGMAPATPRSIGMNDDRELAVGILALSIHRSPTRVSPNLAVTVRELPEDPRQASLRSEEA